jgi:AcrR family transcriptional regulator
MRQKGELMSSRIKHRSAAELLGVPRATGNARYRLVDKAIDLFYQHGFHSVGLDEILAETGVTKTTFYKHFQSKDDLVLAAIAQRDQWEAEAWDRAVRKLAGDDPRKQLLAIFDVLDVWFNDPSFGGCMFINAAAEFADPREPAHQAAAAHKKRSRNWWRELARTAGAKDPDSFADRFTVIVEGTLIMRHVHARNDAARFMRPMAESLLQEFIPAVQRA